MVNYTGASFPTDETLPKTTGNFTRGYLADIKKSNRTRIFFGKFTSMNPREMHR